MDNSKNIEIILDILWGGVILFMAGGGLRLVRRLFAKIRPGYTRDRLLEVKTNEMSLASKELTSILKFSLRREGKWVVMLLAVWTILIFCFPGVAEVKAMVVFFIVIYGFSFVANDMSSLYEQADAKGMELAIKKAIEQGDNLKVHAIIQGAWDVGNRIWQYKAVASATQFKSPWTDLFLHETTQNPPDIVEAEEGIATYSSLTAEEGSEDELHLDNLKRLMKMDSFWGWLALSSQRGEDFQLSEEAIEGLNAKLEKAFLHQAQLVATHPDTFCLEGLVRGVLKSENEWKYVVSPISGDYRKMKAGIHTVIGHIGPVEEAETESGTLRLPLWDAANNKAIPMELDAIAIVGGADFNYDWAVSASIEVLRNRFPEKEFKLDVDIDPSLGLSENTLALLQAISIRS